MYVYIGRYLCWSGEVVVGKVALESKFMHDPVSFFSFGSSPFVENKSFLHSDQTVSTSVNLSVFAGSLPVAGFRCPVRSHPCGILSVSLAEEEPFLLSHFSLLCNHITTYTHNKLKQHLINWEIYQQIQHYTKYANSVIFSISCSLQPTFLSTSIIASLKWLI